VTRFVKLASLGKKMSWEYYRRSIHETLPQRWRHPRCTEPAPKATQDTLMRWRQILRATPSSIRHKVKHPRCDVVVCNSRCIGQLPHHVQCRRLDILLTVCCICFATHVHPPHALSHSVGVGILIANNGYLRHQRRCSAAHVVWGQLAARYTRQLEDAF
jgi:hypothetical protein